MAGPPEPREARSEGKLHAPAIQSRKHLIGGPWMGGSSPPMVRIWNNWKSKKFALYYASPLELLAMMTFVLTLFVMYWLPTIVSVARHTPSALGVAALNFFFGWTVIGWIMALIWALAAHPQPQVIVIENGRVVRS